MKTLPFDSRDRQYKTAFGAVEEGSAVCYRLLLPESTSDAVAMLIRADGEDFLRFSMIRGETENGFAWYSYTHTFADAGLYFYRFEVEGALLMRFDFGQGRFGEGGKDWQQTVYRKTPMPQGFAGGLIYQIFPDRFYGSGKRKKNVPTDRFLRSDWGGTPAWRQNGEPCSLGNDYFGGDLAGITEKLDYLQGLGVTVLYLNPVFEAHSNHRYNTADYLNIDPLLGTEADFKVLCKQAAARGIKVIFDGVFSHTGDDSVYFDRYGRYGGKGAASFENSPYRSWYRFRRWPDDYAAWWNVPSLPETEEENPDFLNFITGEDGVIAHWMRCGAAGVRLDVADELPDVFLDALSARVKAEDPDGLVLGEVWEDASNKISYGARRRYLLGGQLDSVMNYPFAALILTFVQGGDAFRLLDGVMEIIEDYPREVVSLLMNHIGTHDTARVLTRLALGDRLPEGRAAQEGLTLTAKEREKGKTLLRLAALLQYTLPGIPSLYYGDEAGLSGGADPFCRGCYPWGEEDTDLLALYRFLGNLRREHTAFAGAFIPKFAGLGLLAFERADDTEELLIAVNRWQETDTLAVEEKWQDAAPLYGRPPKDGVLTLPPFDFCVLHRKK